MSEQYAIYLRKSRVDLEAEAHGEGETLARHEKMLLDLASRRGYSIGEIYREIVSGDSISARPEMQRLMADVEAGIWAGVLVVEVERLARGDSLDQGLVSRAFRYSDTLIITPLKTYDPSNEFDEEYFEFGLFMSRRELKTITRRQQRGRVASVQEGKWPANKAPYGYRRVKLSGQKGWTLEPDEHADTVRDIFRWYTSGMDDGTGLRRLGVSLIVRQLNERGIPSATGKDWTNAVIRGILRNPAYAGFCRWGHRPTQKRISDGHVIVVRPQVEDIQLFPALHPALVDQSTFDSAQSLLKINPSRPGPKQVTMKNPLSGLVRCSKCGRAMVRRPYKDHPDSLICPYTSCDTVGSELSTVEAALLDALRVWYSELKAGEHPASRIDEEISGTKKALDKLSTELEKTRTQLSKTFELVETGVYDRSTFLMRQRELSERIDATERGIAASQDNLSRLLTLKDTEILQLPRLRHLLDAYNDELSPDEKNSLLHTVLDKVVYSKTSRERWKSGSDMTLQLFPLIPRP